MFWFCLVTAPPLLHASSDWHANAVQCSTRRGSRGALAGGHGIRGRVSSDALHISTL